jgi:FMN phosphatase YigB (HAD superfamily)
MKIVISSDFLMTSGQEQDSNLRWLADLLSRPLQRATGITPIAYSTARHTDGLDFNRQQFFLLSGIADEGTQTQQYFDTEQIESSSIDYLRKATEGVAVLIGYELSRQTRQILERAQVTYVDLWLHPIRYLDDVLFGIYSDHSGINAALDAFDLPEDIFYLYADRLRVQNYRGFRRSRARLQSGSALFIGQTLVDKAICDRGRMLTLLDYKERFTQLTRDYQHVYYSRHPFVREGDEAVLAFLKSLKNVHLADDPTYHLLASDEISHVASISSSVAYEAHYFGKRTEFYFRPVIDLNNGGARYRSVMHEPYYGWFWAKALASVLPTANLPEIRFHEPKDKTRDALAFYWGYRNIDKLESLKQTVAHLSERGTELSKKAETLSTSAVDVQTLIAQAQVVSFDVFDTLITRRLISPRDVFDRVAQSYAAESGHQIVNFRRYRVLAEEAAHNAAQSRRVEDCTLEEIYSELGKLLDLPASVTNRLQEIECAVEYHCSLPRRRGIELYEYARSAGCRVVLTSDMYLPLQIIERLLAKAGIDGHEKLYLSCDVGAKKKTGSLFELLIRDQGIRSADLLHIGDNEVGDFAVPRQLGVVAYRIPRALDIARRAEGSVRQFFDYVQFNKSPLLDAFSCMILDRYFDDEEQTQTSLFGGDPFRLGYCGLAPVVVSFVLWLKVEAERRGIRTLYFLSRDMKIAYDVFTALFPESPITARYLYASRRSVKVPLIRSRADMLAPVHATLYANRLGDWLRYTYGISVDTHVQSVLADFGLRADHLIGAGFEKAILEKIVLRLEPEILSRAAYERDTLREYLQVNDLTAASQGAAIVDLGYACSVQAAYHQLFDIKMQGLYFALFNTAIKNLSDPAAAAGHAVHFGSAKSSGHSISTHRFVYESLFCDADSSFECIERMPDGQLSLIKTIDFDDQQRTRLVEQVHQGVRSFVSELGVYVADLESAPPLDPMSASKALAMMLSSPNAADAAMFEGVRFEDALVSGVERYLIPPRSTMADKALWSHAIWKEGTTVVRRAWGNRPSVSGQKDVAAPMRATRWLPRTVLYLERRGIALMRSERKIRKYHRDRQLFFLDSRSRLARLYFRMIGSKLYEADDGDNAL